MPPDDHGLAAELQTRRIKTLCNDVPVQFATTRKRPTWRTPIKRRRWVATKIEEIQQRTEIACASAAKQLKNVQAIYSNTTATLLGHQLSQRLSLPHIWHLREFPENYGMHLADGVSAFRERLDSASQLIAISKTVAQRLAGPQEDRCHIIYNGVGELAEFESYWKRRSERPENPVFRFLLLGQILPSKGHDQAIRAMERILELGLKAELHIVGSGDQGWLDGLVASSSAAKSIRVFPPTDAPFQTIIDADTLLMCSPMEAMGRVTVEAMVAGCPVIGLDAFGTTELIDHGSTGFLYRTDSELAAAMAKMMTNEEQRNTIAKSAFQTASTKFNNRNYANRVADVLRLVLSS